MITNAELTQMKERAEKATAGPWTSTKSGENTFAIDSETITSAFYLAFVENDCNASFIVHAREDVPRLVAEVEHLQALLRQRARQLEGERKGSQRVQAENARLRKALEYYADLRNYQEWRDGYAGSRGTSVEILRDYGRRAGEALR